MFAINGKLKVSIIQLSAHCYNHIFYIMMQIMGRGGGVVDISTREHLLHYRKTCLWGSAPTAVSSKDNHTHSNLRVILRISLFAAIVQGGINVISALELKSYICWVIFCLYCCDKFGKAQADQLTHWCHPFFQYYRSEKTGFVKHAKFLTTVDSSATVNSALILKRKIE